MGELLKWDEVGKHLYEIGVRRGVLYVQDTDGTYGNGEAWNEVVGKRAMQCTINPSIARLFDRSIARLFDRSTTVARIFI